jgi:lipoprotein-anchoring transpeptidase ErfK/SrfK
VPHAYIKTRSKPILAALMFAAFLAQVPTAALARSETVLVTPQGDLLGYVPEQGEYQIKVDPRGFHIFFDNYGMIVATEMPASVYFQGGGNDWMMRQTLNGEMPLDIPDDSLATGSLQDYPLANDGGVYSQPLPDTADQEALPPETRPEIQPDTQMANIAPDAQALPQAADPAPGIPLTTKSSPEITALQVFLDREGISPGVIDGKPGSNVNKAIIAWEAMTGQTLDPNNSEDILERLRFNGGLPIVSYQITAADAAGPYVASIPEDYSQKAALPSMAYTSTTEALAERFHMDEAYLKALNPGVDFTQPGVTIKVVSPGEPKKAQVTRIVANKRIKLLQAFDASGNLVAAYPASIGSSDTPSPSGTHAVQRIALDPNYTYNPKINFQQGANDKILTIPPGPNGPVGSVWIALDKPTYGIHGTPEPSKIGKTQSHGCVRLTNWDARELAKMVSPGTIVQFVD